ncbi:hypothetical protein COO60DRAFT_1706346 [Scenedesmus sp. NREL 46B-D3]|nr:hypothetical protein COO60DRAFT_1706346 [Scenedesmus sp. NREL 46B-D3]
MATPTFNPAAAAAGPPAFPANPAAAAAAAAAAGTPGIGILPEELQKMQKALSAAGHPLFPSAAAGPSSSGGKLGASPAKLRMNCEGPILEWLFSLENWLYNNSVPQHKLFTTALTFIDPAVLTLVVPNGDLAAFYWQAAHHTLQNLKHCIKASTNGGGGNADYSHLATTQRHQALDARRTTGKPPKPGTHPDADSRQRCIERRDINAGCYWPTHAGEWRVASIWSWWLIDDAVLGNADAGQQSQQLAAALQQQPSLDVGPSRRGGKETYVMKPSMAQKSGIAAWASAVAL